MAESTRKTRRGDARGQGTWKAHEKTAEGKRAGQTHKRDAPGRRTRGTQKGNTQAKDAKTHKKNAPGKRQFFERFSWGIALEKCAMGGGLELRLSEEIGGFGIFYENPQVPAPPPFAPVF